MPKKMPPLDMDELSAILVESRKLAIRCKHDFIDYAHLFVGILYTDCTAAKFCEHCNKEEWRAWLEKTYANTRLEPADEVLLLTKSAERMVHHAWDIALKTDGAPVNSVHLLLAILTPENDISNFFSRSGILYEDIVKQYCNKTVHKFPPVFDPVRKGMYAKWRQFFMPDSLRKKKFIQLYQQAIELWQYQQYDLCMDVCRIGLGLDAHDTNFKALLASCYDRKRDVDVALTVTTVDYEVMPPATAEH